MPRCKVLCAGNVALDLLARVGSVWLWPRPPAKTGGERSFTIECALPE